ncbi:MAG: antibiotic biosynthesis monooxygenase [Synergistaceae bacterium]|nr:antibiotic biosynthesis monooxygenase [Synergistaceae bacterium]
MKLLALMFVCLMFAGQAEAHTVFAPAGKTLKVHWAVLQAKPGKMQEMAAISARTVAKYTPNESGSYSLYGGIDAKNPDLMRILEIYEDEAAYQVHRDSEGFKAFITEREPILESLKILPVDAIVLEQKKQGTGKCVMMNLIEVKPEYLEEFKALTVQEFSRAVAEEAEVLVMFATSEQGDRQNFIHTLEVYADDEAMQKYLRSEKYESFRKKADTMTESRKEVSNNPANVTLSSKGLHLSPDGQELSAFPLGQPNNAYAQYFDGQSYLAPLSLEQVGIFNVTFEPGCRNHWHIHHAEKGGGQILVCVAGRGYYQEWGKPARELHPGDVVNIPANVKHWHGAAKDSWFQHLAVEVGGEGTSNEWCEAVDPEEYALLK